MKVLLADPAHSVRSALRLLLEELPCVERVDEVAEADGLTRALWTDRPDVLLVDWTLPGLDHRELVESVRAACGGKLLVLGRHPDQRGSVLAEGADGFVTKGDGPDRLIAALASVGLQAA